MRDRLKKAIDDSGLSQRAIAVKAGISEGTIRYALKNGNITVENLSAICRTIGVSLSSLLSDDTPSTSPRIDAPESEEMARLMRDLTTEERKKALDIVRALKYGFIGNKKAS